MRRRRLPHRPAPPRRALVWLPPVEALATTAAFRDAHDPLAAMLPPHVTLVFPFESTLGDVQVAAHVRRVLARWPAIPVRFEGLGHFHFDWIHRRVTRGYHALMELHDRLYRGALAPFLRPEPPYEPHLTIARARDPEDCAALIADAEERFARSDEAVVRALTLCRLRDDGVFDCATHFALGNA